MLGGPGIGYTQDVNIAAKLRKLNPAVYAAGQVGRSKPAFCSFRPSKDLTEPKLPRSQPKVGRKLRCSDDVEQATELWPCSMALKITAAIPATMAVGYLILLIYFRAIGGYKLVEIGPGGKEVETSHRPTAKEAVYKDSPPIKLEMRQHLLKFGYIRPERPPSGDDAELCKNRRTLDDHVRPPLNPDRIFSISRRLESSARHTWHPHPGDLAEGEGIAFLELVVGCYLVAGKVAAIDMKLARFVVVSPRVGADCSV